MISYYSKIPGIPEINEKIKLIIYDINNPLRLHRKGQNSKMVFVKN